MSTCSCTVGKKQVPFSMAVGSEELGQECFPLARGIGCISSKYMYICHYVIYVNILIIRKFC